VSGVIDGRRRDGAAVIDCHSSSSTTTRPDRHGVSLRVVCRTPSAARHRHCSKVYNWIRARILDFNHTSAFHCLPCRAYAQLTEEPDCVAPHKNHLLVMEASHFLPGIWNSFTTPPLTLQQL